MNHMEVERDAEIRELAYQIWQEEGYPHGQEVQQWLKAEAICRRNIARTASLKILSRFGPNVRREERAVKQKPPQDPSNPAPLVSSATIQQELNSSPRLMPCALE